MGKRCLRTCGIKIFGVRPIRGPHFSFRNDVALSSLSLIFLFLSRKTPKFTKEFPFLSNPIKPWKNQGKHPNNQGNALLEIQQGNSKKQGKEGQGTSPVFSARNAPKKPHPESYQRCISWLSIILLRLPTKRPNVLFCSCQAAKKCGHQTGLTASCLLRVVGTPRCSFRR